METMEGIKRYRLIELPEGWKDGESIVKEEDRILFTLRGESPEENSETAAAIVLETGADADGEWALCIFKDCLRKEYALGLEEDENRMKIYPGWEKCALRKKLNTEILDRFPEALRARMIPFENGDLLRIPTEKEIFGKNEYGKEEPEETRRLPGTENVKRRIAALGLGGEEPAWYWLQNRSVHSAVGAADVGWIGYAYRRGVSDVHAVRPLFKIRNR